MVGAPLNHLWTYQTHYKTQSEIKDGVLHHCKTEQQQIHTHHL